MSFLKQSVAVNGVKYPQSYSSIGSRVVPRRFLIFFSHSGLLHRLESAALVSPS